jgi:hypothetical protein
MRLYRFAFHEIEEVVVAMNLWGVDRASNPIFIGRSADGRRMKVVMALDAPDYVITVFGEKR